MSEDRRALVHTPYRAAALEREGADRGLARAALCSPRAAAVSRWVLRPLYVGAPRALALALAAAFVQQTQLMVALPVLFIATALLVGRALTPGSTRSYHRAREAVKERYAAHGSGAARAEALAQLRAMARRPWRCTHDEQQKALYGYATICLTDGALDEVSAVERTLEAPRRDGPTVAIAAVLRRDANAVERCFSATPRRARDEVDWAAAEALARQAGFDLGPPTRLDDEFRRYLAHAERLLREGQRRFWPHRLDPWTLAMLEARVAWLTRAGPLDEFSTLRAHLGRERARLGGEPFAGPDYSSSPR